MKWSTTRTAALGVALALTLVGCSGSSGATAAPSTAAGTPTTGSQAPASTGPTASIDTTPFLVGWASTPDEEYLPILMAIDAMKNDGYDATGQQLASEDLMYQGLSANTVQLATGGLSQVARAVDQGVPVKAVDTRNSSDTVYVAANDYQDCSKLAGKPVGIYAPKAIFTLFMELYFDQHCKGVAYTPVTIADSALRAQAMEQGQILATVLGLPDAIALNARKPGQFYMVAFGKELPGIADSYLIANTTTLADHPSIVDAFVREHMTAIRTLYTADDSTLTSLLKQYLPKVTDLTVMKGLLADKLFYTNGGLAGDGLDQSLKAFKLPSDRAHIIDDGPVNRALAVLGQSDLTTR